MHLFEFMDQPWVFNSLRATLAIFWSAETRVRFADTISGSPWRHLGSPKIKTAIPSLNLEQAQLPLRGTWQNARIKIKSAALSAIRILIWLPTRH